MKTLITLLAVFLLSGCGESEYRKLHWESKKKDMEIEILKKQIIIDSLKRHDILKKDTLIIPFERKIDTISDRVEKLNIDSLIKQWGP